MSTHSVLIKYLFVGTIILFFAPVRGQSVSKEIVGKTIDTFSLETLLQAPHKELHDWGFLNGKVVILEFWTTWCAPCIKQIPHLNELTEKFRKKPVQFIAITPEELYLVDRLLKQKKINSWIGLDIDHSILNELGIQSYPTTIIVDKKGIIREITRPEKLTEEKIEYYLTGNFIDAEKEINTLMAEAQYTGTMMTSISATTTDQKLGVNSDDKPVFEIVIKESKNTGSFGYNAKEMGRVNLSGASVKEILSMAYGVSQFLIQGDSAILNKQFDVKAILPADKELFEGILQQAIKKRINFRTEVKQAIVAGYALLKHSDGLKGLYPSKIVNSRHASNDVGIIAAQNFPLKFLISTLESELGIMIEDKTGLNEKYDFQLFYDQSNPKSVIKAMEQQLGLVLQPLEREMQVLLVSAK